MNMLFYLATPYSKYMEGDLNKAFVDASQLAGRLMLAGINVYSPIAHSHALAIHSYINPLDHSIWLPFDELMMSRCDALIVAHMDGWQQSVGMAHEIEWFEKAAKPIYDLDVKLLKTTARGK